MTMEVPAGKGGLEGVELVDVMQSGGYKFPNDAVGSRHREGILSYENT